MKTDLERLHQVYNGEIKGRKVGNTFLQCHKIAGQIEVGNTNNIICIVENYDYVNKTIKPMLLDILEEHNIKITKVLQYNIFINNIQVLFKLNKGGDELAGYRNYCLFYL